MPGRHRRSGSCEDCAYPSLPCCPTRWFRQLRGELSLYSPNWRNLSPAADRGCGQITRFRAAAHLPAGREEWQACAETAGAPLAGPYDIADTRYLLVEPLIPPSRDPGRAGQAIDAALSALRRGEPVLLYGQGEAVLALAAEFVNEDNLQRLRQVSTRPLRAILTRRRAVALGLARRDALSGAVSIALAPELPAGVIRNLGDPAASLGADPPGLGPEPAIAEGPELAAVALAKLAALLPAVLVLPLAPSEAALARRRRDFAPVDTADVLSRRAAMTGLTQVAEARVPLADAEDARLIAFRPGDGGTEHLAILIGTPAPGKPVLVRLHSECFTGDLLASL